MGPLALPRGEGSGSVSGRVWKAVTQFNSGVFGLCYSSSPVTAEDINGGGGEVLRLRGRRGPSTPPRCLAWPGAVCMEPGSLRGCVCVCVYTHVFSHPHAHARTSCRKFHTRNSCSRASELVRVRSGCTGILHPFTLRSK